MGAGFHVICDKPLTTNLDSAVSLARKVKETGVEFCLTPADRVDRNFPSVDDGVKGLGVVEAAIRFRLTAFVIRKSVHHLTT
jgi:hypothetical protein